MLWALFSLRTGEIACRRIGGYQDVEDMPLPSFLRLAATVRAYEADELLRELSAKVRIAELTDPKLGASSSKTLSSMLQDLDRIRTTPLA